MEHQRKVWTPSQQARLEYFRGQSFFLENRHQDAINSFEMALALDPNVYYIHEALGNACAAVRDYDRAIARYLLVLNKTGDSLPPRQAAMLHVELASAYEKKFLFADALLHYSRAVMLDPSNVIAQRRAVEISREHL